MKNKYELMGQYVQVKAYMKPSRKFQAREHLRYELESPRVGMVVGYRTVYDGKIGIGNNYPPDDFEPNYFINTKSIKVVLVCFWPTYKPVLVAPEDVSNISWEVPFSELYHPSFYKWNDQNRDDLRKIMKDMPRDIKGRWF